MIRLLDIISYKFQEYVRQPHPVPSGQEFQRQQEADDPTAEEQPHHVSWTQSLRQSASVGKPVSTSILKLKCTDIFQIDLYPTKRLFVKKQLSLFLLIISMLFL